mgnify:CR=1 FL=1
MMKLSRKFLLRGAGAALLLYLLCIALIAWDGLIDEPGKADVALVLGNQVYADGTPSDRLKGRLDEGLRLWRAGDCRYVIVSSGYGEQGQDEAAAMQRYLLAQGMPKDAIIVDSSGVNTYASARYTRAFLLAHGMKSVIAVTQYYHIPRSKLALRRFGIEEVYSSHARYFEWRDFFSIQRDGGGYVLYALLGYL